MDEVDAVKKDSLVYIPSNLVEALNGVLAVCFFWMLCFVVYHLYRTFVAAREKFPGKGGLWRTYCYLYHHNKPEIALLTITTGLWLRISVIWYARHLRDHHVRADYEWYAEIAPYLLTATTVVIIIGVSCWIRVISPLEGRYAILSWTFMMLSATLFGIGMLYY